MGYSGSYDKSLIDLSFSHDDIFLVGMPSFLALLAAACVNASFEPLKIKSKSLIFIYLVLYFYFVQFHVLAFF